MITAKEMSRVLTTTIIEAKVTDATIKKIAGLTDRNDAVGALIEMAKLTGNKNLVKVFEALQAIQNFDGSLESDVQKVRERFRTKVLKPALDKKLGKEDAARVWQAG